MNDINRAVFKPLRAGRDDQIEYDVKFFDEDGLPAPPLAGKKAKPQFRTIYVGEEAFYIPGIDARASKHGSVYGPPPEANGTNWFVLIAGLVEDTLYECSGTPNGSDQKGSFGYLLSITDTEKASSTNQIKYPVGAMILATPWLETPYTFAVIETHVSTLAGIGVRTSIIGAGIVGPRDAGFKLTEVV